MKHVSVLIPEGDISLSNVEGIHHMLTEVNKLLERQGKPPAFQLQLVGKRIDNIMKENFFSVHTGRLISEDFTTNLIIIPALHTDVAKGLALNKDLLPWIIAQYQKGAEIVSLCTGTFLLAATGLLNGKKSTTHWIHADEFRDLFPDVQLVKDEIMTHEKGIYTSGAAYSYLNLILYLIEKYTSRDVMVWISKVFAIDVDRQKQSHFIIFEGYKAHQDGNILKVQEFIEENYDQRITVDQLAGMVALGRRNFERRFKQATTSSVVEYVQMVKIEAAKKLLERGMKTINEVMYDIGYNDTKSFRDVFKRITGMSPVDYRNRFNREVMV